MNDYEDKDDQSLRDSFIEIYGQREGRRAFRGFVLRLAAQTHRRVVELEQKAVKRLDELRDGQ